MENDGGAFSAKLVKENEGEWVSVMMILPKWSFENREIARVCKLKAHWRQQRPKWFSEWDNWAVRACWRGYWANSRQFCVTYRDRWSFERVFFCCFYYLYVHLTVGFRFVIFEICSSLCWGEYITREWNWARWCRQMPASYDLGQQQIICCRDEALVRSNLILGKLVDWCDFGKSKMKVVG